MTDFLQGTAMMQAAEEISNLFLQEIHIPAAGAMCGAPHFHEHEPQYELTELLSA